MIKQFIFIPGMARSGTTWVSEWIAQREDVAFFDESYLIQKAFEFSDGQWSYRFVTDQHIRDLITTIYEDSAEGKPIILDKSPASLTLNKKMLTSTYIHRLFPDAKVLIMHRDGKQYVYSVMNLPWGNAPIKDVDEAVSIWITRAKILLSRSAEFSENPKSVRYEDLLEQPDEKGKEIADFLGLELPPLEPWKVPVKTKNSKYVPNRWKRLDKESLRVMRRMNPFLKRMGYDPV